MSLSKHLTLALILTPLAAAAACVTNDEVPVGADCPNGFCNESPPFTPVDAGDAEAAATPAVLACVGTECTAPYATCSPTQRCGVNLMNDPDNCGACGVSCNGFGDLHLSSHCVEGVCVFACTALSAGMIFRDCDDVIDNGCETDVANDAMNCGVCGHQCAPGVRCIKGFCGCFAPRIDCNGECKDTSDDDTNCKECGNFCGTPDTPCEPMPANTKYGCRDGECGKLKCLGPYADCNDDLTGCSSDGCETFVADEKNCGGCGIQCAPGQECTPDQDGRLRCEATCASAGLTRCRGQCRNLLDDPATCGTCDISCFGGGWGNQVSVCKKGICSVECQPGFADCNGDPDDGCEVALASDAANCGACGSQCDLAAGQPCIEGKCLMVACDGGVVTTK